MKLKIILLAFIWISLVQLAPDSFNRFVTSQSDQCQSSKTIEAAQAKPYKLGEIIPVKAGLTLKVVPGSSRSRELFAAKVKVEEKPLVFDLEFNGGEAADGDVLFLGLSEAADRSDVVLQAGEERIAPQGFGLIEGVNLPEGHPPVLRVVDMNLIAKTGQRLAMLSGLKGRKVISLLFDLKGKQFEQNKKLIFSFHVGEAYSFVIDLN